LLSEEEDRPVILAAAAEFLQMQAGLEVVVLSTLQVQTSIFRGHLHYSLHLPRVVSEMTELTRYPMVVLEAAVVLEKDHQTVMEGAVMVFL